MTGKETELYSNPESDAGASPPSEGPWDGLDFSGTTVVLGVGTGRLIQILAEQAALSQGQLVVTSFQAEPLRLLAPLQAQSPLTLVQSRPRQIPLADASVDLLLANGVLRQVPSQMYAPMVEELWRVLLPGGHLRISDIVEPSEAPYDLAWSLKNALVRKLGAALGRPTALSVDLMGLAMALRAAGFEELSVSLLPGYLLTEAWLQETVESLRTMVGQVADRALRDAILAEDALRLVEAFKAGGQRAAERTVLKGRKPGDLALEMSASFTEQDLLPTD